MLMLDSCETSANGSSHLANFGVPTEEVEGVGAGDNKVNGMEDAHLMRLHLRHGHSTISHFGKVLYWDVTYLFYLTGDE